MTFLHLPAPHSHVHAATFPITAPAGLAGTISSVPTHTGRSPEPMSRQATPPVAGGGAWALASVAGSPPRGRDRFGSIQERMRHDAIVGDIGVSTILSARTKGMEMQTYGISTEIRDLTDDLADDWHDATRDGHVCRIEIARITRYIRTLVPMTARQDDGVRIAASVLKIGPDTKRNQERIRDYGRVHGPVPIAPHRRRRRPIDLAAARDAKRRRSDGPPNGAA